MTCRICLEEGDLIQPCNCSGTAAYVHKECLVKWLNTSGRTDCEICKYTYELLEVEEEVETSYTQWRLTDEDNTASAVVASGLIGHLLVIFYTAYWGMTTKDMFCYCNAMHVCMVGILYSIIRPREVLVFFKCCSFFCLLISSIVHGEWTFFMFEAIITSVLVLHTYAHLTTPQKEMVQYINIEDRSLNDTAVQRS